MKKKTLMIICIIFSLAAVIALARGRYIYNIIKEHILETQGFYFNSTSLSVNGSFHNYDNWDGVTPYQITVDLNNKKNNKIYSKSDITYDINVTCPNNATCVTSKNNGTIYSNEGADSYLITITPIGNIDEGDKITINTSVSSTSPYEKSLHGSYTIGVAKANFSYSIEDNVGSKYLTLRLLNSFSYYQVKTAFGEYSVGDHISVDTYNDLTKTDKEKCFSAQVKLSFSPSEILLDLNDKNYLNRISQTTKYINGYSYVNSVTFKMSALSAEKVIFYKKDSSQNYTYPGNNSIITVTPTTVD